MPTLTHRFTDLEIGRHYVSGRAEIDYRSRDNWSVGNLFEVICVTKDGRQICTMLWPLSRIAALVAEQDARDIEEAIGAEMDEEPSAKDQREWDRGWGKD